MTSVVSDSNDNFYIQYPTEASNELRAVFLAAGLMLDYTYFEEPQQNANQNNVVIY
jgi:hypothetical protein